jgi:hypothetical protein
VTIRTNVAWAVPGDNLFRGYSVKNELAGRDGYWSLLSLAVGGSRLSVADAAYVDDLASCMQAADPRIWPLKVAWLVGSYGTRSAAIAATEVYLEHALVSGFQCAKGAETWNVLDAVIAGGGEAGLARWIENAARDRLKVSGFGVPGRAGDERIEVLKGCVARHGREHGRRYESFLMVEKLVRDMPPVWQPNIALAYGACGLDLGLRPDEIGLFAHAALCVPIWANAVEAAKLAPASLRTLPADVVRYRGTAPRSSARAIAAGRDPR